MPPEPALSPIIRRWMYGTAFADFVHQDSASILGELLARSTGDVELTQRTAWETQIRILKTLRIPSSILETARIYFELTVPRLGRRADVALLTDCALFIMEFKVGESTFTTAALDQVWDYALDFKYFHDASHPICIVPILVATEAAPQPINVLLTAHNDGLTQPIKAASQQISDVISLALANLVGPRIVGSVWERGRYLPTPTIIEAARALYAGHSVENISRTDAGATNLTITSKSIDSIIENSQRLQRKSLCFVTGVPGAGKTLVGLNVAHHHLNPNSDTYSVFLSGNGPLVSVLREALARDNVDRSLNEGIKLRIGDARKKVDAFIQNVHHFRDEYLDDLGAPPEHVVLFDEAQRAWNLAQTTAFMTRKRKRPDFAHSEPEFLISCMDRHPDWAVVVCLVGSGQEIGTGEGGIAEWLSAVMTKFQSWDVYLPTRLMDSEYQSQEMLARVRARTNTRVDDELHLSTSLRSFRAESLSRFVRELLDCEAESAKLTLGEFSGRYPILLTRDLSRAKAWLRRQARGSERVGLVVSSQAERLKPHAIDVRVKIDPVRWFLDPKEDTRSSYYLEDAATEFQVQGLELDWACVVWDGDLRFNNGEWAHHQFRGSSWIRIRKEERQKYLKNSYRVLLTRARQGIVLVVPEGDDSDPTRAKSIYDPTYGYLKSVGLTEL